MEVPLREYIEKQIKWIKDLMDERSKETERRLGDLNHENARILASQARSVSLEKYEAEMKGVNEKITDLQKSRNITTGRERQSSTVWAYVLAIGAILIAMASLIASMGGF